MPTIVLTGGGTAGHVLPAVALLPHLRGAFDKIVYIGSHDGVEKEIAGANELPYFGIATIKLRRTLTLKNLAIPFKLLAGIREAKAILKRIRPDIIFSKGGFVALPVVCAAAKLGIPVVAHESDMSMGLANRLTAKKCRTVCTTFPIKHKGLTNLLHTGAIIREDLYHGDKAQITRYSVSFDNNKPNLLIMGGSSGAAAVNSAVWRILDTLINTFNVLHITGKGKGNPNIKKYGYVQAEYLPSPKNAYAWADVVISRAGSGAVAELIALGKPAVLLPLSKAESRGDQIQNARYAADLGVCEVVLHEDLTDENLLSAVKSAYDKRRQFGAACAKVKWVDGTERVLNCLLSAHRPRST